MECDLCNSKAIINFQKVWVKFEIDKDDNYKEDKNFDCLDIEEPIEENNVHLCEKHSEQWLNGEI